jgi:predicted dehydrogenase
MKSLKIAAVGGFGHAKNVFDELAGFPELQLQAVAPAHAEESIDGFLCHPWALSSKARRYDDLATLCEALKPDVLIVSTRPDHIQPIALAAIRAGCHLIVEKPLALDLASLQQLYEALCASQVRMMAMLSMRSLPAFRQAKALIESGAIGQPLLINARKSYKWGQRPEWYGDRKRYGGTWPWVGIHALDMAEYLTGLQATSVYALHANRGHRKYPGCEDSAVGIFQLQNSVSMTVSIDLFRPNSCRVWGDDWCRVVGDKGSIEANASTGQVRLINADHDGVIQSFANQPEAIYQPFLAAIANDTPWPEDPRLPFRLTAAALQARQAADTGKVELIRDSFLN